MKMTLILASALAFAALAAPAAVAQECDPTYTVCSYEYEGSFGDCITRPTYEYCYAYSYAERGMSAWLFVAQLRAGEREDAQSATFTGSDDCRSAQADGQYAESERFVAFYSLLAGGDIAVGTFDYAGSFEIEDSCEGWQYAEEGVAQGDYARGSFFTPVADIYAGATAGSYEGEWTMNSDGDVECFRFANAYVQVYGDKTVGNTGVEAFRSTDC
ncbi:MAG TPA: hypothetical protein VFH78_14770 [Candidatus Thermoplasmatota archaeon]|nr:hypothetical protein [Candidatus Thermoplasmatota archaeon]